MAASSSKDAPKMPFDDSSDFMSSDDAGNRSSDMDDSDLEAFLMGGDVSKKKKKRKAKGDGEDEEEVEQESQAAPKGKAAPKKRRKKTTATGSSARLSAKAKELLGKSNMAYIQGEFQEAIEVSMQVIAEAPGLADPFHMLGVIHEELGNLKESEDFFLLAAHLNPGDAQLWRRIANVAKNRNDVNQQLYCLRRCLRNATDDDTLFDDVLWEIANVHMDKKSYDRALRYMKKLSVRRPKDPEVATELAKVYYKLKRKFEAITLLESLVDELIKESSEVPENVLHLLCEVYIEMREYDKCYDLLGKLGILSSPTGFQTVLPEIVCHVAICACHLGKEEVLLRAADVLREPELLQEQWEFILKVIDSLFEKERQDLALGIMQEIVEDVPELLEKWDVQVRMARCYHATEQYEEAVEWLDGVVKEFKKEKREKENDPEVKKIFMLYSECLQRVGRTVEADEVLMNMSYRDIKASETVPEAISTERRVDYYEKLNKLLDMKQDGKPLLMQEDSVRARIHRKEFVTLFGTLIRDCELDQMRVMQYKLQSDMKNEDESLENGGEADGSKSLIVHKQAKEKKKKGQKSGKISWNASTIMKQMGLTSIEEKLGTKVFIEFVERGLEIFRMEGFIREAVELVETIIRHRKRSKAETYQGKSWALERLYLKSLTFAMEINLTSIAISNLRNLKAADTIPDHIACFFDRIMFRKAYKNSTKFITQQRAFLFRRVYNQPESYPLTFMAGHFCTVGGRYLDAVAEYSRAYAIKQAMKQEQEPLLLLCIATAYMNFSISRTVAHRHETIIKALSYMYDYAKSGREEAEWAYNLAHFYHNYELYHLAVPLYERSLKALDERRQENNGVDAPHFFNLRMCVAHNMSLILQSVDNADAARSVYYSNIVW